MMGVRKTKIGFRHFRQPITRCGLASARNLFWGVHGPEVAAPSLLMDDVVAVLMLTVEVRPRHEVVCLWNSAIIKSDGMSPPPVYGPVGDDEHRHWSRWSSGGSRSSGGGELHVI